MFKLIAHGVKDYDDTTHLRWVWLRFTGDPAEVDPAQAPDQPDAYEEIFYERFNKVLDFIQQEIGVPMHTYQSDNAGGWFANHAYSECKGQRLLIKQRFGLDV